MNFCGLSSLHLSVIAGPPGRPRENKAAFWKLTGLWPSPRLSRPLPTRREPALKAKLINRRESGPDVGLMARQSSLASLGVPARSTRVCANDPELIGMTWPTAAPHEAPQGMLRVSHPAPGAPQVFSQVFFPRVLPRCFRASWQGCPGGFGLGSSGWQRRSPTVPWRS